MARGLRWQRLQSGVPATIYADIIRIVQSGGARVILDTSGKALIHGCHTGPYLVKPNAFEAHTLTGLPVDSLDQIIAAAQAVRELGTQVVVVSMGKDGAMLVEDERVWGKYRAT